MANTTFVDQSTVIVASWLNDINTTVYNLLGNGTIVPATVAALRTNIGLGTIAVQNANAVAITGGTITGTTITGNITGNASGLSATNPVTTGGTGVATTTAYSPVFTGTTATGAFQVNLGPGSAGQVLTSAGAGALPTWSATGSVPTTLNHVINGNGLIQQRTAPTLTAALQYGAADRHLVGVTGATGVSGTVGVLSNAGFSAGVGYGAIAASWTTGAWIYKHRIEGQSTKSLNSNSITVSGKLYQDTGGSRNFTVSIGKPTTILDTFSAVTTLGTSGAIAVATGTVTSFSYTLALGATDATLGLEILITDTATNTVVSKNYALSDLQLEIGTSATSFQTRLPSVEWAACKRFYRRLGFNTTTRLQGVRIDSASAAYFGLPLDPPMRVSPSVTVIGSGTVAVNDRSVADPVSVIAGNVSLSDYLCVSLTTSGTLTVDRPAYLQISNADTGFTLSAEL